MNQRPPSTEIRPDAGVAFLMVLTILMALMMLAAPFLLTATHQSRASVKPEARAQARARLDAMLKYARFRLESGHAAEEQILGAGGNLNAAVGIGQADVDTEEEMRVPLDLLNKKGEPVTDPDGVPLFRNQNSRGATVDLRVRDEHAYPNLHASPTFLIAATLGRTELTDELTDTAAEILVEDASAFPATGGFINIEGEVISYGRRDGNRFLQCQRGLKGGMRARAHAAEAFVLDDRARELAMLPFASPRAEGGYREPTLVGYVKEIALLGRSTLSANEVDLIDRTFSFQGRRPQSGAFGEPVRVTRDIDPATDDGNGFPVNVASSEGFNPGTVVRIYDGQSIEFGMIVSNRGGGGGGGGGGRGGGFGMIILAGPTSRPYVAGRTYVQPLLRQPVNINTAPKEVLLRVMEGVQLSFGRPRGSTGRVTRQAAVVAAEAIIQSRPIADFQQLRQVLESLTVGSLGIFSPDHLHAIFRNAVDSNDSLLFHSTVPFCFASYDHFRLEGASVVADQSGRELARLRVRERVHVAPTGLLTHLLDTQADFEDPILRARAGKYVATYPHPIDRWVSPTAVPPTRIPRMLYRLGGFDVGEMFGQKAGEENEDAAFQNGVFPDREQGFVRLATARVDELGYTQHFDGPAFGIPDPSVPLERIDDQGWRLGKGPFEFDPRDSAGGFGNFGGRGGGRRGGRRGGGDPRFQGSLMQRTTPNPVRFDLWFETGNGAGGDAPLLDLVGAEEQEDWVKFSRAANGDLVGRVDDRTIDDRTDRLEEVAEVRWTPENPGFWLPKTWYHLGFAYRGTKPADLSLVVDGYKRGKSKYTTRLLGTMSATDTSFQVESAEGWPDQGVALVGSEAIAFERSGESFQVVTLQGQPWGRGQRGSRALPHATGTPVEIFGYSLPPITANRNQGIAIPRGGGQLKDTLGPFVVASFEPNAMMPITLQGQGGIPITIQLEVHDPSKPGGNILSLSTTSLGTASFDAFPRSGGYVMIVSLDVPVNGGPQGSLEVARYRSRSGNQLIGLEAVPNPPNEILAAGAGTGAAGTPVIDTLRHIHPVRLAGSGPAPNLPILSCVFPISIAVTDVSGYKTPEMYRGNAPGAGGQNIWTVLPEFVQVGSPNTDTLEQNLVEWIRYNHIDEENGHLLCDEGVYLLNAAFILRNYYLGGGSLQNAHVTLREIFPMRQQCGTRDLSDGRPQSGTEVVPCIRTASFSARGSINNPNWTPQTPDSPSRGEPWSSAGFGDSVTIEGQNGRDRRLARVAWAAIDYPANVPTPLPGQNGQPQNVTFPRAPDYDAQGWIAFTESVGTEYRQRGLPRNGEVQSPAERTGYCRLLKFPSGELPNLGAQARSLAGGNAAGDTASADATIDELRVTPFDPERFCVWSHSAAAFNQVTGTGTGAGGGRAVGVDAGSSEIPISRYEWLLGEPRNPAVEPRYYVLPDGRQILYSETMPQGLPNNRAGLVKIDEEIIAFRSIGASSDGGAALLECTRGFMGSIATDHGLGAEVVFLDFFTVSDLGSAVDGTSSRFPVGEARIFPQNGGTVLIDSEMLHYTSIEGGELVMPLALNEQGEAVGGLLRGRYGSAPAGHAADSIVLEMPFRYWDRYVARQDSAELSYFGFSLDLPDAFFRSISIEKVRPGQHVDVDLICRTDPQVPWSVNPAQTRGLFEFSDPTEKEPGMILTSGRGLDVRVRFKYLPGAFAPDLLTAHDWKRSADLERLRVEYLDETRVLGREELR